MNKAEKSELNKIAKEISTSLWGIHAGKHGEVDSLFLKENVVALGWPMMGDMSVLPSNRETFKEKLAQVFPDRKPGYYPIAAGQLFRFVHQVTKDDLVIYPSKQSHQIHIGKIVGPYEYNSQRSADYPQQRPVKWLKSLPRTKFSQGALYEIGSAMSFFQVKNFADEYLAVLSGQEIAQAPKQDETVSYIVEDIEQNTQDFILKTLAQELKGHAFAEFVAHLLNSMGYRTRLSPEGPDGGVDIIAHKDELGFEPPLIKIQVKSTEGSVGDPIVSQLNGKVDKSEYGMVVTIGTFTGQARIEARHKSNLRLIDGEELVKLILQHYEQLDAKYKGLMPLKRVYIPELISDELSG